MGYIRRRVDLFVVVSCGFQLLIWMSSLTSGQVTCVKMINSCQCQTKSGKYIDLAPLANRHDYRFKQVKGPSGAWLYSYNPCFGFTCEGSGDVAMCQTGSPSLEFALGTQDTAKFGYDLKNGLNIQYTSSHTGTTRISLVKLTCPQTDADEFTPVDDGILSDSNTYTYTSTLSSKHACEVDSLTDILGEGGVSPGDVLLIVVFVGAFLYLTGGFAFSVLVQKKPLGPGALPNAGFWLALFGYIREGAVFCWDRLLQLFTQRKAGYEGVK